MLRRRRAAYPHGCGARACKIGAVKPSCRRLAPEEASWKTAQRCSIAPVSDCARYGRLVFCPIGCQIPRLRTLPAHPTMRHRVQVHGTLRVRRRRRGDHEHRRPCLSRHAVALLPCPDGGKAARPRRNRCMRQGAADEKRKKEAEQQHPRAMARQSAVVQ